MRFIRICPRHRVELIEPTVRLKGPEVLRCSGAGDETRGHDATKWVVLDTQKDRVVGVGGSNNAGGWPR